MSNRARKTAPRRDLRPFKFVVQAVLLEYDGELPKTEHPCEPVVLYGEEKLIEWARGFDATIEPLRRNETV